MFETIISQELRRSILYTCHEALWAGTLVVMFELMYQFPYTGSNQNWTSNSCTRKIILNDIAVCLTMNTCTLDRSSANKMKIMLSTCFSVFLMLCTQYIKGNWELLWNYKSCDYESDSPRKGLAPHGLQRELAQAMDGRWMVPRRATYWEEFGRQYVGSN